MNISFEDGLKNQLLVNPKLNDDEKITFKSLQEKFEQTFEKENYFFIASSGSSKKENESAKLIAIHREAVLNSARRFNQTFLATQKDIWGLVLPTFHVAGLSILARAHLLQSRVVSSAWMPEQIENWLILNEISFLSLVPAQVFDLVQLKVKRTSFIKKVFVGAGSLTDSLRSEFKNLGWPLVETYGMTETCSMIAVKEDDFHFKVMPHVQVKVEQNILSIQCDSLAHSSIQRKNQDIQISALQINGWFKTEDQVKLTLSASETHLEFLGRDTDYIKILGEGVSLPELREKLEQIILQQNLNLIHFHLLAVEDSRLENLLILAVENSVNSEVKEAIVKSFNQAVRPYEKIHQLIAIDLIPRTDLQKVKLDELKKSILQKMNRRSDDKKV